MVQREGGVSHARREVRNPDFFVDQIEHDLLDHLYHDEPSARPIIRPIGVYQRR
jgi:hypothetical protein